MRGRAPEFGTVSEERDEDAALRYIRALFDGVPLCITKLRSCKVKDVGPMDIFATARLAHVRYDTQVHYFNATHPKPNDRCVNSLIQLRGQMTGVAYLTAEELLYAPGRRNIVYLVNLCVYRTIMC